MILRPSIFCQAFVATAMLGVIFAACVPTQAESKRRETRKPVLTHPKFDPTAERVGLFDGMDDGRLETKVIARDATGGFVIVSNNTEQPLTVELPEAFVGVQVLKQFGGGMGGMGGGGMGGMGGGGMGGMGGGGMGGGGNQQMGGGMGGGGMGGMGGGGMGGMGGGGMGGMGGGGGGFFSIPPERSVKVPYVSACLNHGKPDPNPRVEYRLVPVEQYTQDPVLAELIRLVGTGRVDQHSAQAAIWTRTDNMSWQQLATKSHRNLSGVVEYYFSSVHIAEAQLLAAKAEGLVREAKGRRDESAAEVTESRVR